MVDPSEDQRRRDAITAWWEGKALRDFIAQKRAALRARAHTSKETNNVAD